MDRIRGPRRLRARLATAFTALTLAVVAFAAPAQAAPQSSERPASALPGSPTTTTFGADPVGVQASCRGTHSIWADSWSVNGSAGTVCDGNASFLRAVVYIRQRDSFGFVSTCAGGYAYRDAYYTTSVVAPARCGAGGSSYTYWIYSEHYAEINGQVFSFTGGHWN